VIYQNPFPVAPPPPPPRVSEGGRVEVTVLAIRKQELLRFLESYSIHEPPALGRKGEASPLDILLNDSRNTETADFDRQGSEFRDLFEWLYSAKISTGLHLAETTKRVDPAGWSALHWAAQQNKHELIAPLAASKANVDAVMSPPGWALEITVKRGEDLISKDSNGFSDPYCTVAFSRCSHFIPKSTPIIKATLNPVWNETFILSLADFFQVRYIRSLRSRQSLCSG